MVWALLDRQIVLLFLSWLCLTERVLAANSTDSCSRDSGVINLRNAETAVRKGHDSLMLLRDEMASFRNNGSMQLENIRNRIGALRTNVSIMSEQYNSTVFNETQLALNQVLIDVVQASVLNLTAKLQEARELVRSSALSYEILQVKVTAKISEVAELVQEVQELYVNTTSMASTTDTLRISLEELRTNLSDTSSDSETLSQNITALSEALQQLKVDMEEVNSTSIDVSPSFPLEFRASGFPETCVNQTCLRCTNASLLLQCVRPPQQLESLDSCRDAGLAVPNWTRTLVVYWSSDVGAIYADPQSRASCCFDSSGLYSCE